jgi:hypothetical protein
MMMEIYTFWLVVSEHIDDDGANRLFDAGVDDGLVESGPLGHSIGFDREASSLSEAVLSAVDAVEQAGFEVLRVEPDDLVSASDVAERTGRSRQSISFLIGGERGPGGWPRAVAGNVRSPLWRWNEVAEWFETLDGSHSVDRDAAVFLAAVNEVLAARRALRALGGPVRQQLVDRLQLIY